VKRTILSAIVCLFVLAALLSSCGGGTATTTKTAQPTGSTTTALPTGTKTTATTPTTTTPDVPKTGGRYRMVSTLNISGFDHGIWPQGFLNNVFVVNDTLVIGDWTKGAAGTGQVDWGLNSQKRTDFTVGLIAESFSFPEAGTIVFKIRRGIRYWVSDDLPTSKLINGREVTADDVAFSLTRHIQSPLSYLNVTQPTAKNTTTATKTGDWEVTVKTALNDLDAVWLILGEREIWPRELIEKYNPKGITDWRNQVGNGPFIMKDFVDTSSATFVRNPNYWGKDPIGPGKGNQLPYLDGIDLFIISDASTNQAAFRTGKLDVMRNVGHDDFLVMQQGTPNMQFHKYLQGAGMIGMRTDKPNLPFSDIKVRKALMMATDFDALIKRFMGGDGEIVGWPLVNTPAYAKAYMPLDQMPADVKALYTYNPDAAKALLQEAGYANGFKTTLMVSSQATAVDYASALVAQWAKVNVTLDLQIKEQVAYFTILTTRQYDGMAYGFFVQPGPYAQLLPFRGSNTFNISWVKDAKVEEVYQQITNYNLVNQAKVDELHRGLMPYVLGQAWYIPNPVPYAYNLWQPWLKNYHGEGQIGYQDSWVRYIWVDQELKKQLGK
jgi:peptide/nickel transport system substrate-binding protein